MSIFIGIDNGIAGGIAAYDTGSGRGLRVTPMPVVGVKTAKGNKNEYNIPAILQWFDQLYQGPKMVVIERANAFPGQGVVSQFTIGKNFGIMCGILSARKFPYQIVAPQAWQKKMFEGIAHTDSKQASILVAQRLFPDTNFVATEKGNKISDGMTDAALMAYYAYQTNHD